ncbi:MAG: phosphodiester glycosidase family protein [Cyanobacteria bacterium HKST-UBA02]|nr:phosphodiester glycosidase family protein [Cyanobacteria bacterium HKST-UBA02]
MDNKLSTITYGTLIAFQSLVALSLLAFALTFFFARATFFSVFPDLEQWRLPAMVEKVARVSPTGEKLPPRPLFLPPPLPKEPPAPPLAFLPPLPEPLKGKPVIFQKGETSGVPYYIARVSLKDPETFMTIGLPHGATMANSPTVQNGDESFPSFVKRMKAAVIINGTFFSKDQQKRVMGNMVADGKVLKYSQWENYGTTLGIKLGNQPEMITARRQGKPNYDDYWFSITCGPRLLDNGSPCVDPQAEGFADPHVLGVGPRCAMGYPASRDSIYLLVFLKGLSLKKEAEVMKALGCLDAMNLDGGASRAIAHMGTVVVPASRSLTNVIAVYDTSCHAPQAVRSSWRQFQREKLSKQKGGIWPFGS